MLSADATRVIAAASDNGLVVLTMTTIYTWPEGCPTPTIRCAPLMGGGAAIGLGLALAQPDRKVLVLDGDGSLLMQLGGLATVAGARPHNFFHLVFDNGVLYERGGRLPVANAGHIDYEGLARMAGYPATYSCTTADDLRLTMPTILATTGPVFVRLVIEPRPLPRWSQQSPQPEIPDWWFTMLYEDARTMARHLSVR